MPGLSRRQRRGQLCWCGLFLTCGLASGTFASIVSRRDHPEVQYHDARPLVAAGNRATSFEAQKAAGHARPSTTWEYTVTDADRERQHAARILDRVRPASDQTHAAR